MCRALTVSDLCGVSNSLGLSLALKGFWTEEAVQQVLIRRVQKMRKMFLIRSGGDSGAQEAFSASVVTALGTAPQSLEEN